MVRFFFILIVFGKLFSIDISCSDVCENCHLDELTRAKIVCEGGGTFWQKVRYYATFACSDHLNCENKFIKQFNGTADHKQELCSNSSRATASPPPSQSSYTSPQSSSTTTFTEQSTSTPTLDSTSNITSNITSFLRRSAGIDTAALSTGEKVGIGVAGLAGTALLIYRGVTYFKAKNDNKSGENDGHSDSMQSPIYTRDDANVLLENAYL